MKKIITALFLASFLLVTCGCTANDTEEGADVYDNSEKSTVSETQDQTDSEIITHEEGIPFYTMFMGFEPILSSDNIDLSGIVSSPVFITSEEQFNEFCLKYCDTAGFFATPDFSEYTVVALCDIYGSHAGIVSSSSVEKVSVGNDGLIFETVERTRENTVYAGSTVGISHLFVNMIVIGNDDIEAAQSTYDGISAD